MGTVLVITFRETLEMALILIPLVIYLKKIDKLSLSKHIFTGIFSGLALSTVVATIIYFLLNSFTANLQELLIGFLALIISALILYNLVIINKVKNFSDIDSFKNTITPTALFTLALITVFRESIEVILFILPILLTSVMTTLIGLILGVLFTIVASFIIYKSTLKININIIFILITLVLIYFGALLFGEALMTFLPQYGASIQKLGMLIYGIPTLLIFLKKTLKKYLNKML